MANTTRRTLHGIYDRKEVHNLSSSVGKTVTALNKTVNVMERELSYRFHTHFHPYVAELVQQLIKGSVGALQTTDTQYEENSDRTLKPLPHSTMVTLGTDINVLLKGNTEKKLLKGTQLNLLDGAMVRLSNNHQVTLPGDLVVNEPTRGLRVTVDGARETIAFGAQITLVSVAPAVLSDGLQLTLPPDTPFILTGCKPKPKMYSEIFSKDSYAPSELVTQPYPMKDLDFTPGGAYAGYNWELFFHVPLTIAIHLSKNQRFEEAMRWFHYIFNPTDDSDGPTPERFWKVRAFQFTDVKRIEEILINLVTEKDPALAEATVNSINQWKDAPFRPHLIARYRPTAYMFKTVMAYLDNLIAWGDSLFRQDTGESINEAMQIYVLAANLLGPRPQAVPKKGSIDTQTYAKLRKELKEFGAVLRDVEADIPFDLMPYPSDRESNDQLSALNDMGKALYFCVPRNDKLLGYWDTVADRLFKIRNSLNIQGIFRQLPLFEPPIDPALLARAAASGLDVGVILSGINQPLPMVRFQLLAQKAAEICQEVKSLGNNLLSVMEKEDNEAMALLRAKHERVILGLAETVRYAQWQEAIKSSEGLQKSLVSAVQRYTYYERQLGKEENQITVPELGALNAAGLAQKRFEQGEPQVQPREIEVDIAQDLGASGGKLINRHESAEIASLKAARDHHDTAGELENTAAILAAIPAFAAYTAPMGCGPTVTIGGRDFANVVQAFSSWQKSEADADTYEAGNMSRIGSYARRQQDWAFQSNLAAAEITQIFKQLRAAQIREFVAEREWQNHKQQMIHSDEIERFLNAEGTEKNGKKTNKALYAWMKREVKGLYGQVFQFAYDIAKKAERALQHELGDPSLSFLQFGYLAGKEGLMAGEKLYLDIKRMEMAYHDLNQREYELTKHVSLSQLDPLKLIELRATGSCTFFLPEELFDMDCPGHYFRRIKSVAVSIPCVTGPYTSVNSTLTLLKSSIRKNTLRPDGYARDGAEDDRFSDYFGSTQSIVTSTGQNDSGLFETNLRDERYLPFEGAGANSKWQLELTAGIPQFDYNTITDVILHLRYTSREGGEILRESAIGNLNQLFKEAQAVGMVRLLSIRHEFPDEWIRFKSARIDEKARAELNIRLRTAHYPFWSQGRLKKVVSVEVIARTDKPKIEITDTADASGKKDTLDDGSLNGILKGRLQQLAPAIPVTPEKTSLKLFFNDNTVEDLWLAITWGE